jgi:hypothetical protein
VRSGVQRSQTNAKLPEERDRLFRFAYEQGQKFVAAYNAGRIKQEDVSTELPAGVLSRLWEPAPTPEFALGRIAEAATQFVLYDIPRLGDSILDDDKRHIVLERFSEKNCRGVAFSAMGKLSWPSASAALHSSSHVRGGPFRAVCRGGNGWAVRCPHCGVFGVSVIVGSFRQGE